MSIYYIKYIAALLVFLVALIAGAIPFYQKIKTTKQQRFPIGEAFACGVFLGAGLIHMLSAASHQFTQLGYHYPFAFVLAGSTFLLMLWLEHLGHELTHKTYSTKSIVAVLAMVMLSIHSFLAGAAVGFSENLSIIIILLLAVLAHKWAAGFSLAVQINQSNFRNLINIILFLIFALMTPLGILFGESISHSMNVPLIIEPIFASLAAGTFLYLGTLHGLKQAILVEHCCNLYHYSFVIFGFTLMALVAIYS